jgi:cell division protein FtsZ
MAIAEQGIAELREVVDSLIVVPNAKLLDVLGAKTSLLKAFAATNEVLNGAVSGISDLITRPGMINVDFADVRTVMSEAGLAMMGTGIAKGDNRAALATEQAICSPLLEGVDLKGARGVLVNIAANDDLSLGEFAEVGDLIAKYAADDATVVVGTVIDPSLEDRVKVTVVATGLSARETIQLQPTVVVDNVQAKPKLNLDNLELPEILKPRCVEALLHKPVKEDPYMDLDYLDIPTFARR